MLGGIKGCKNFERNQNVTLHLGTDGCHSKVFSGGIYYVDVILVHIKTRLDLLGIQTFRWDQRLGRQYSNLNRIVTHKYGSTKVANPARGQLNRENDFFPVPGRA